MKNQLGKCQIFIAKYSKTKGFIERGRFRERDKENRREKAFCEFHAGNLWNKVVWYLVFSNA